MCKFCDWIELSEIEVWSYVSKCGEYNFHVSCITEIIVEESENGTTNILALKNLGLAIQWGLKRLYNFWFIPLLLSKFPWSRKIKPRNIYLSLMFVMVNHLKKLFIID